MSPLSNEEQLVRWLVAALHLLGLGIGLGAVWARGRALRRVDAPGALQRAFYADTAWGLAALVWISTGLWRLLGGLEKGMGYYFSSNAFWTKMSLLGVVLLLELWPMATLVRWRVQQAKGMQPDTGRAGTFAAISFVQALLIVGMVLAATAMARGLWF
jgi:putative membrane protein